MIDWLPIIEQSSKAKRCCWWSNVKSEQLLSVLITSAADWLDRLKSLSCLEQERCEGWFKSLVSKFIVIDFENGERCVTRSSSRQSSIDQPPLFLRDPVEEMCSTKKIVVVIRSSLIRPKEEKFSERIITLINNRIDDIVSIIRSTTDRLMVNPATHVCRLLCTLLHQWCCATSLVRLYFVQISVLLRQSLEQRNGQGEKTKKWKSSLRLTSE